MTHNADTTRGAIGQRRRLPRLHWLSWLTLLASAIVVALLMVPGFGVAPTLLKPQPFMRGATAWGGGPLPNPDLTTGPLRVEEFEHGWPFTCLHRAVGAGGKGWPIDIENYVVISWPNGGISAPWNQRLAWSFSGDVAQWNAAALAADLLIAVALVAIPTLVCQWWIARRGNRLRIRIADLLAMAVVVAAALAWRQSHLRLQSVEQGLLEALPRPSANLQSVWQDHRWEDRGPEWFDRLLGLGNYSCFRHLDQVTVIVDEMTEDDWNLLSQAAYVSNVRLHGRVSAEAADALRSLRHLRALELCGSSNLSDQSFTPAAELEQLSDLRSLASVRCSRDDLLIEDMDAIAAIPTVREIDVSGVLATIDEQHAFRDAHPRLVVNCDDPSRSRFENPGIDPWGIAHARLVRWRKEDSVQLAEPADYERHLDLRGIQLKPERVARLRPVLATAKRLNFDKSAAISAVIELLRECPHVTEIQAAELPANPDLLACMAGMPSLEEVSVSQGSASVEDFRQLMRDREFCWLNLYETTLSKEELSKLLDEFRLRGSVEVYRGLGGANPAIEPVEDPDDPFSQGFGE